MRDSTENEGEKYIACSDKAGIDGVKEGMVDRVFERRSIAYVFSSNLSKLNQSFCN